MNDIQSISDQDLQVQLVNLTAQRLNSEQGIIVIMTELSRRAQQSQAKPDPSNEVRMNLPPLKRITIPKSGE